MELTNAQWNRIEPLFTSPKPKKNGRVHPARDPRVVLDGILWILRTGGTLEVNAPTVSALPDYP